LPFKDKVNSKETDIEKLINTRLARKPLLFCNIEELFTYCMMIERIVFGLTTRGIKRMTFELAIKMVLPVHFQYSREEQAGAARVKGFTKDVAIFLTYLSHCCS
jgi:ABC-type taurine transport system ATPase subunit